MSDVEEKPVSVLFVCLGNICRSPLAEAAFRHIVEEAGVPKTSVSRIDSAGTAGYHTGERPDERKSYHCVGTGMTDSSPAGSLELLQKKGLKTTHRARKVTIDDFDKFDYIFGMDTSNVRDLLRLRNSKGKPGKAWVGLWGGFAEGNDADTTKGEVVADPYYGGMEGFVENWEQAVRFSWASIERIWNIKKASSL